MQLSRTCVYMCIYIYMYKITMQFTMYPQGSKGPNNQVLGFRIVVM